MFDGDAIGICDQVADESWIGGQLLYRLVDLSLVDESHEASFHQT